MCDSGFNRTGNPSRGEAMSTDNLEKPLSKTSLKVSVMAVCKKDSMLQALLDEYGQPPMWERTQSFETLVHIVLEQKVSLASAQAVMQRVQALCSDMSTEQFLAVPEHALRDAGISARKVSYCYSIAKALESGNLSLAGLRRCDDESVLEQLCAIRGIGPWTAGVYLLMAMRRPDAWASGDRALVVSFAESAELEAIPGYREFDDRAARWQPYRAAAARLLWHAYLCRRRR